MSQLDDLFRDGLGARRADVPNTDHLWARINAANNDPLPAGERLDAVFRRGLRGRHAAVPAAMWARITAARGRRPLTRWLAAAAASLLLLTAGYALLRQKPHAGFRTEVVAADHVVAEAYGTDAANAGSADGEVRAEQSNSSVPDFTAGTGAASATTAGPTSAAPTNEGFGTATRPAGPDDLREPVAPAADRSAAEPDREATTAAQRNTLVIAPLASTAAPLRILSAEDLPAVTVVPGKFRSTAAQRGIRTELLFGISYAKQEFSFDNPAAAQLLEVREVSEFAEAGYQITLRSTYQFNDHLRVMGGLTYAEIRNELDYPVLVNGQTVHLYTNNHIRMLEAPLLLGYTFSGRRVNATINVGPVVNLSTGVRGRFLHPDAPQPLDLRTDGNFRSNVGVGFTASLTTAYRIGKQRPFTLLIEPFFKAYPTAFTTADAPLREKYWVAGLQFGVRKSL